MKWRLALTWVKLHGNPLASLLSWLSLVWRRSQSWLTFYSVNQEPFPWRPASVVCHRGHTEVQRLRDSWGVGRVADTEAGRDAADGGDSKRLRPHRHVHLNQSVTERHADGQVLPADSTGKATLWKNLTGDSLSIWLHRLHNHMYNVAHVFKFERCVCSPDRRGQAIDFIKRWKACLNFLPLYKNEAKIFYVGCCHLALNTF